MKISRVPMSPGELLELEIESLAIGGAGVARFEGCVVFVPFTAPGDRVLARVVRVKKRHAEANLERVIAPGPDRVEPVCPAFGVCGGCQWMHLAPGAQDRAKEQALLETLRRIGGIRPQLVDPMIAAPAEERLHYRSRAELHVEASGGLAAVGFHAPGERRVVPLPGGCAVLEPSLEAEALALSSEVWPEGRHRIELPRGTGGTRCQDLRVGDRTLRMTVRPGGFSQVHRGQNRRLVERVLEYAHPAAADTAIDLFCGAGNLTLPLALSAARVIGVEGVRSSIEDAMANAAANGIDNVELRCAEVAAEVRRLRGLSPEVVVMNPPRGGAAAAVKDVLALGALRIVYVSCDPATLARDASTLAAGGYALVRCTAVDMFPQTYHVEAVTLFEKRGGRFQEMESRIAT